LDLAQKAIDHEYWKDQEAMLMWKVFASHDAAPATMSWEQFAEAYRSAEPDVSDEKINMAWDWADLDRSKSLDMGEFRRIYHIKAGPPKDDMAKL
jgi:hypothetical protein